MLSLYIKESLTGPIRDRPCNQSIAIRLRMIALEVLDLCDRNGREVVLVADGVVDPAHPIGLEERRVFDVGDVDAKRLFIDKTLRAARRKAV